LSILENTPKIIETHVVDISEKALEVSKINIQKYKNNIQQYL
jgi:methylase of polypeptide subunit release factors